MAGVAGIRLGGMSLRAPQHDDAVMLGVGRRRHIGDRRRARRWTVVGFTAAGAVVTAGVLGQLLRPLAPPVGDVQAAAAYFDADLLARIEAYRAPLRIASVGAWALRLAVPVLAASTPAGRRAVGRLVDRIGPRHPILAAAAVIVAVLVVADVVVLPIAYWAGFVHEGEWGFRTQGLQGWARDWLVAHAPVWLAAAVLTSGGYALARRLPARWPLVAGLVAAALGAAVAAIAPVVLEPLQYRTRPLADGPVRTAVEQVLERAGEDIDTIVVADASRRTTKINAYVSGLGGSRRVVLWDTLVRGAPPEQMAMVFAHELAHDRHGDVFRMVLLGGAGSVLAAFALAGVLRGASHRGWIHGPADARGAAIALAAVAVLTNLAAPIEMAASRRAEAAADQASLELTRDPSSFAQLHRSLVRSNLSDPDPPTWAILRWGSHPTPLQRLERGRLWAAAAEPLP